jgi:hypothetical protein
MADPRAAEASSAIEFVDDDSAAHRNSVNQRLRANSTIMQVKKLLGKLVISLLSFCCGVFEYYVSL